MKWNHMKVIKTFVHQPFPSFSDFRVDAASPVGVHGSNEIPLELADHPGWGLPNVDSATSKGSSLWDKKKRNKKKKKQLELEQNSSIELSCSMCPISMFPEGFTAKKVTKRLA